METLLSLARSKQRNEENKISRAILAKNLDKEFTKLQIARFLGFSKSSVPNFIKSYDLYEFQSPCKLRHFEKRFDCEEAKNIINDFLFP